VTSTVGRENGDLAISFIIPSWRDSENLTSLLPKLAALPGRVEIIVVEVSLEGRAPSRPFDSTAVRFVTVTNPNRGEQMNHGASIATGDVLVFHHADTEFTPEHLHAIEVVMRDPSVVGGAFHRKFDERHPRLMWLETFARWRAGRGATLYGDQSIFVRRDVFQKLGGFAPIPLMEDVEFSPRLRRAGKVVLLDPPLRSSARHHERKGAWKRTIQNGALLLLYKVGVPPRRLHRWYYGQAETA
jgi:rSAM/selenodomain-associated transferase 2